MPRLIDRDALMERVGLLRKDVSLHTLIGQIMHEIFEAPIIDAEPVRHGRWNWEEKNAGRPTCSECGMTRLFADSPYCPNCYAKMDLEPGTEREGAE